MLLPVISMATSLLAFADYPLQSVQLGVGVVLVVTALWLFYRAHADLGTNWSMTLELREDHRLVTSGVYANVRHPMYAALFAEALAQALLLPNWVAGPAFLLAFTLMFVLRFRVEERMMLGKFGADCEAYMNQTKRLIPGVW
jgi:protein-S-isoprenylcysteine O-methyltransferase Ste14